MFSLHGAYILTRKMIKIGNQFTNFRNADLEKCDLTPSQAETLIFFYHYPGALVSDLKVHMEISHQAARNLVERMKIKELLFAEVSSRDARAKHVYLTEKGQEIYERIRQSSNDAGSLIFEGFTEEELAQLSTLLEKIHHNLKSR